jgi:hypothetical protein
MVGSKPAEWTGLALVIGVLVAVPACAAADDLPETPILANAFRAGWLQFGIRSGRVTLDGSRGINVTTSSNGSIPREQLTIRMAGGDPIVDYQLAASDEDLTVEMSSRNRWHVHRKPKGNSKIVPIEIDQPAQGAILVRVGDKQRERTLHVAGIWHLAVIEPEVAKEHVLPLVRFLERDWDLTKTVREIETALVAAASDPNRPNRRRWTEWVEQLGDSRFAKRESADRQLRESGRMVATFLQQLDPSRLDAEQQFRVRRITASLADSEGNDTPEQVAAWLAGDPSIWIAMLSRDDLTTRKLAARQLEALLGSPVSFDPAAEPAARKIQIEQLRRTVADEQGSGGWKNGPPGPASK